MDAGALNLFSSDAGAPTVNTMVDILNATNAQSALTDVDAAIEQVSSVTNEVCFECKMTQSKQL